jgi:hypothetical protein
MDEQSSPWGIVELMGHKVVAGQVSKSELLGNPMLRVDVPATSTYPAFSQFYGQTAIYCVTFVSEEVARLTAEQSKVNPVSVYAPNIISAERHQAEVDHLREEIRKLRALPAPSAERDKMCTCGHSKGVHCGDDGCEECGCDGFLLQEIPF